MTEPSHETIPERVDTQRHIANVTEILLKKMPIEKINVKTIVEASQTSRTTFYRYFKDKYDVIIWIYISEVERLIRQEHNPYDLWLKIFEFMYSRRKFFISALSYEQQNSLINYMEDRSYADCVQIVKEALGLEKLSRETEFSINFFVGGCVRTWQTWVAEGMRDKPEFIASVITNNIPESLKEFF